MEDVYGRLRKMSFLVLAACFAICSIVSAHADDDDRGRGGESRAYAIGLWGDLPYSDLQAQVGVPNLIADMNDQKLAFTVHDGDLKAGSGTPGSVTPTTCSDALYQQGLGYFNALKSAAMVTPGDNDWTDCDRPANGSFNSRDRLDHERKVFFSTDYSLGQRPIKQQVQHDKLCLDHNNQLTGCVENRRWIMKGVVYATLNIQGSCNNRCDTLPDDAEWAARNNANILWMQQTFEMARTYRAAAIMFISQADPGWDQSDGTRAPLRDRRRLRKRTPIRMVSRLSWSRCAMRWSPSASPSPTFMATPITSVSTGHSSTARAGGSKTSSASRPSATIRRTATTTCIG
ncbi:hypothetical protein [Bradyrhizobium diazoefficiens]|uniref:hypothetical protein n=1 Tax=Bradyrhizobium diazoefficiens TaxID=1355477 RepID=UPI003221603E